MKNEALAAIVQDCRRPKSDGTYPVKLRVTFKRRQVYYSAGLSMSIKDFEKTWLSPKPQKIHKQKKTWLKKVESKAEDIIKSLPEDSFTFEIFQRHFQTSGSDVANVYSAFDNYIATLRQQGRVGTASHYHCALTSLRKVTRKQALTFSQVDVSFLKEYEKKMLEQWNSITTVSMYVRCLRALFNEAIETGIVKRELYPFGKKRYQVPAVKNIKKALPLSDIEKIFHHSAAPGTTEQWALDIWKFSYLCNGMNIADIARLKFKNIEGDKIYFLRSKTEQTSRRNLKQVVVLVTGRILEIIDRWKSKSEDPENYVFGILEQRSGAEEERRRVKQATKTVNKYIKRIALAAGIERPVTSYTARHSFSTVLKRSGAPTEYISESLGHSDLRTTEIYLDSFEDNTRKKYSEMLTDFSTKS